MDNEREMDKFSWSGLFFVTSCCFFLFSLALKILEGQFSRWLLIIGAATGILGLLSWGISMIDRQYVKKRKNNRFAS
ncbi:MAG TPA: hypothetical protein VGO58_17095 [Chitinophagaceae bacterium]|jgi:hypothetical protein|nr:hypothetical protein [Chitinophagaceae bacterium]